MSRSPREVAEQVRRMVAGEGVDFAGLFAPDGVLTYPFGLPGQPAELRGREAIRAYFAGRSGARDLLVMEGVDAVVRQTDDPEVVVTEITHHGYSKAAGAAVPAHRPRRDPGPRRRDRPVRRLHEPDRGGPDARPDRRARCRPQRRSGQRRSGQRRSEQGVSEPAAAAPSTIPPMTWAVVWSRTATRDQPSKPASRKPASTGGP